MSRRRAMVFALPELGHLNPLMGPARALERRGYEIVWATDADVRDSLRDAGWDHVLLPDGALPPSASLRGRALAETIADPIALRGWIRALLVEAPLPAVEPCRAMIREARPHVIAIDPMVYAAAIAAELEGVPWVGWSTSLNPIVPADWRSPLIDTLRELDPERHHLFASHGLTARFAVSDLLAPRGTATFTTEALVGPPRDATVLLVGPSRDGHRLGPSLRLDTDAPVIYASFGSQAWYQPTRFERLVEATTGLGVMLVAAMGDLAEDFRARDLPEHVRCEAFVDQPRLLQQARVLVTHGGANSVMEALTAGVPMLISPLCNDQPHNLAFVDSVGAGLGIDLETAPVDAIREALERLLEDGPHRHAAAGIADGYRARDGADGAAALAEAAIP